MAEVIPFRGILYNTAKVSGADVVAPPYDIITPGLRNALYKKGAYNIVRIDSGKEDPGDGEEENKYVRAARYLRTWMDEGILRKSENPCFYAYEMAYALKGETKKLRGFFGLVRLEELGKGVYPHEETHSKPKADRLRLMRACEANTSPIFSLYDSPEQAASRVIDRAAAVEPYLEAEDQDGAFHRLWTIEGEEATAAISRDLAGKDIFIADGHHRYETALEYRKIMRETSGRAGGNEPCDYVLMFLANIADGNLTILPAHRVVKCDREDTLGRLAEHFAIETMPPDSDIIEHMKGKSRTFGLFRRGDPQDYLLSYRGEGVKDIPPALGGLDVTILHELILKRILRATVIRYEMDPAVAREMVREGGYNAVFFLNPTRVEDVERVALSSLRMPPKSTYFYPKVMTGFVINSLRTS
ncbi:MAG: DUF1015 domain-containing protein [Nitrospirae bacterium]|nr:DUF1015 domain-containing protein [Nitrospirota bacterium]